MGERIPKLSAKVHGTCHWLAGKRRLSKAETCPSSSHRSSFQSAPSRTSLQSTSTLPSTAHVRTSLEPHLEPFTSCSFCPDDRPCAQSLLTARESHVLHLLACAGMAVNTHGVHLEQAELLLGATAAPAVRFRWAGAGPLQAAGWCSRAVGSGATSSSPLTMIKGSSSISVWWTFSSFAHRRDF